MMRRVGLIKLGYINIDMKNKMSNRFYTKYMIKYSLQIKK